MGIFFEPVYSFEDSLNKLIYCKCRISYWIENLTFLDLLILYSCDFQGILSTVSSCFQPLEASSLTSSVLLTEHWLYLLFYIPLNNLQATECNLRFWLGPLPSSPSDLLTCPTVPKGKPRHIQLVRKKPWNETSEQWELTNDGNIICQTVRVR